MKVKSLQSVESTKYRGGWYFWRAHSKAAYEHRSTEHSVVPKESGRPVCHHSSLVHLLGTNGVSLGSRQSNMTISSPCVYKVCVPEGCSDGGWIGRVSKYQNPDPTLGKCYLFENKQKLRSRTLY